MRQIFLDTETTGLDPRSGDRIVEIACVEMVGRQLTGRTLHRYLNPERPVHPDALKVHGLTDEFLSDKPRFVDVAEDFMAFVRDAELLIHNADFDIGFLDAELQRLQLPAMKTVAAKVSDTLRMARDRYPGKANSLDALCRRLEVDNTHRNFHGALLDCGLLAEVYIRMTRGQDSLVIDAHESRGTDGAPTERMDFSAFVLPVPQPTAQELAAHERLLIDLDKASGGKTLWRQWQALEAT